MDNPQLKKYAELIVRSGGNVQKGQLVIISCDIGDAYFGRLVQEYAYDVGASNVSMEWSDRSSTRLTYLRAEDKTFDTFPSWLVEKYKHRDGEGAVYLHITSGDPDLLAGVDPDRLKRYSKISQTALKDHSDLLMSGVLRWMGCAIPSPAWAKKVFPSLPEAEAMERLWALVLKASRADGIDPVADWVTHNNNFNKRLGYLNEQQFSALHFTTGLGTDLTIGLVENHVWTGGADTANDGLSFLPNIPTEEIWTAPDYRTTQGRVVASMPLSYHGNLIEGMEFTFKDGEVIDYRANRCQEILENIIGTDSGSCRLGEVALVASSSPISQMNTLFYNTLYDENASCHLALGRAYPKNVKNGTNLTKEELAAVGMNDSLIHVDFMFGTSDMKVVGIGKDGNKTVIVDSGDFV